MTERYDINSLRESVKSRMDSWRYNHTLGVERAARAIGELYLPHMTDRLVCAALLHDITKNESVEKQLQFCSEFDIIVRDSDKISPKLLHAKTAAELILREYPDYAADDIVSAVRWHTTGRDGMSLFDIIIYLADYIEDTRTFDDCVRLREYFWGKSPQNMTDRDKIIHLYKTAVMSVDLTLENLIRENSFIDEDTVRFRNCCLHEIYVQEKGVN